MDQQMFDDLKKSLDAEGAPAAIERLCQGLRERKDYTNLFYAMLLKKRFELPAFLKHFATNLYLLARQD